MRTINWFYILPKGFEQNLDLQPSDLWTQVQLLLGRKMPPLPNLNKLYLAKEHVLRWYSEKIGIALPISDIVIIRSTIPVATFGAGTLGGVGAAVKSTIEGANTWGSGWTVNDSILTIAMCQELDNVKQGGFAASYPWIGLAVLGDAFIDAICERDYMLLFPANDLYATVENQEASLAHEIGHNIFGMGHTDGPDGKNIMGGGTWLGLKEATLTIEQVLQARAWFS